MVNGLRFVQALRCICAAACLYSLWCNNANGMLISFDASFRHHLTLKAAKKKHTQNCGTQNFEILLMHIVLK